MFHKNQINGSGLPDKTLSLTFDDGPGHQSLALAEYLANEGIHATFFLVGIHIEQYPKIPAQIRNLGHALGNHTYDHATWAETFKTEGTPPIEQVIKAESLIRTVTGSRTTYFRPPGGYWSGRAAEMLNLNTDISKNHAGSFTWDIDKGDWHFWKNSLPPEDCAQAYHQHIAAKRKGIVLMHDSSADGDGSEGRYRPLDLARLLVPALLRAGYKFVGLEAIPETISALNE